MAKKIKTHDSEKLSPVLEQKLKARAKKMFAQLCIDKQMVPTHELKGIRYRCFLAGFLCCAMFFATYGIAYQISIGR